MLSVEEMRKLIPDSDKLSDAEIEHIRDLEERLADIFFDQWLRKRKAGGGVKY